MIISFRMDIVEPKLPANGDDDGIRPALAHALIDFYQDKPVLVATDSYKLAVLALPLDDDIDWQKLAGHSISRADLTRWYKLASNSEPLFTGQIAEMAKDRSEENHANLDAGEAVFKYPDWQKIVDVELKEGSTGAEGTHRIGFNAKYALVLETLAGKQLGYELNGSLSPMIARENGNLYLLMPLRS